MTKPEDPIPVHVDGRAAVVRQDLDNVLHPVVAHRQLEAEPLVIVAGRGSTVVDADGTEYLDAMAGLQVFQISTYGGHPVAAAVANRNIEIILEERLVDRSAENGAYLLDGLRTLLKHPWVGDVRGKGLFAGIELVRDRRTKEAVPADRMKGVVDFARPEIDRVVAVLDKAIAEMGSLLGAS